MFRIGYTDMSTEPMETVSWCCAIEENWLAKQKEESKFFDHVTWLVIGTEPDVKFKCAMTEQWRITTKAISEDDSKKDWQKKRSDCGCNAMKPDSLHCRNAALSHTTWNCAQVVCLMTHSAEWGGKKQKYTVTGNTCNRLQKCLTRRKIIRK